MRTRLLPIGSPRLSLLLLWRTRNITLYDKPTDDVSTLKISSIHPCSLPPLNPSKPANSNLAHSALLVPLRIPQLAMLLIIIPTELLRCLLRLFCLALARLLIVPLIQLRLLALSPLETTTLPAPDSRG